MGSSKKIANGFFWTTLFNIINGIYGFVSVPILISYFGKSNYGLIGLAISVNVYLCLMDLGFSSTNVRFFSNWLTKKDFQLVKKLFQTSLSFYGLIGLLNGLILFTLSLFSNQIFNLESEQDIILKNLLCILAVSAFISWFTSCFEQLIKSHECVGWLQKMMFIPKIFQILVLIFTVWFGLSIEWYYALTVFAMLAILPLAITKIHRIAPYISFIPHFDKAILLKILPYSLNIFSFGIFQFSINYLRPVLLGVRGSIDNVADYRILNGIIGIVLMLGGAFMGVILPTASKVVALGDKNAQNKIAYDGTKYITIILCFCCFGMMSVSREVLLLYVGKDYLYLNMWLDFWLLTTLFSHNQAISSLALAISDIRMITYSTIISSVVGLLLCWFLIPSSGIGATVIAYCVYGSIQTLFYYIYYWPRKMKINSIKVLMGSFLPSVCVGIVSMLFVKLGFQYCCWVENTWNIFLYKGILFFVLYFGMIYLWVMNVSDLLFFKKMVK